MRSAQAPRAPPLTEGASGRAVNVKEACDRDDVT